MILRISIVGRVTAIRAEPAAMEAAARPLDPAEAAAVDTRMEELGGYESAMSARLGLGATARGEP
jgi:hypothetical protein